VPRQTVFRRTLDYFTTGGKKNILKNRIFKCVWPGALGVCTVMEHLEKSWHFLNGYFQAWKSPLKKDSQKDFQKVFEKESCKCVYIHMFIHAEYDIINMLFIKIKTLKI